MCIPASGLFVASHAGNNGETDNDHDVEDFMVYAYRNPVIIDVGSGTYTARTFSKAVVQYIRKSQFANYKWRGTKAKVAHFTHRKITGCKDHGAEHKETRGR